MTTQHSNDATVADITTASNATVKKRGRPRKQRTQLELKQLESAKKNKMSQMQKMELKLQVQREKTMAVDECDKPDSNYYCKKNELQDMLLQWRNSDENGFPILKKVNDKLIKTKLTAEYALHEKYSPGTEYFVKIPKNISKFEFKADPKKTADENLQVKQAYFDAIHARLKLDLAHLVKVGELQEPKFYSQTKDYIIHNVTYFVKLDGWAFNFDVIEMRRISDELGEMLMKIGKKLLNHSNFRNYDQELKADMLMFGVQKIIRGLKNYNFKFINPFAWITQGFWNSYLIVIYKHYRQFNIKRDLMKKLSLEIETYGGMDPRSSLNRAIRMYIGDEPVE